MAQEHPLILILHGPNLNLLGEREPDVYGAETLEQINDRCHEHALGRHYSVMAQQSNHEGALIDTLHEVRQQVHGVVFNPGAYTHTSIALHDAILAVQLPVVEVHLSDISRREAFRQHSHIAPACIDQISGHGWRSYILGIDRLIDYLRDRDNL